MKKVLFATTALVATAGVASADIALSGSAEMGVRGGTDVTSQFHQDIDVTFTMSGTTDNGLTFGAAIDIDESRSDAAFSGPDDGGVAVFVSGDFGTLTLGDTDGALDWALREVDIGNGGSLGDDETSHAGFNGNSGLDGWYDGQVLRYDYSFGEFGFAVAVTADDDTIDPGLGFDIDDAVTDNFVDAAFENNPDVTADPIWSIGARYNGAFAGGEFGVGIGYQFTNDGLDQLLDDAVSCGPCGVDIAATEEIDFTDSDESASVLGVSASVSLDSGFSAAVNYSVIEFDISDAVVRDLVLVTETRIGSAGRLDGTHFGIGASYEFDAITVHANYGMYDWDDNANALGIADASGYGLSAAYDLGGGLSAHLGYGYSDVDGSDNSSTYSFGLAMSF